MSLNVLAQVSIDSAKRSFDVNINDEITRIKKEVGVEDNKYPLFWKYVNQDIEQKKINKSSQNPQAFRVPMKIY